MKRVEYVSRKVLDRYFDRLDIKYQRLQGRIRALELASKEEE